MPHDPFCFATPPWRLTLAERVGVAAGLALFPPRYTRGGDALAVLGWYAAALGAELLDRQIFALGGIVGGHTVKHVCAALAACWVLRMLRLRRHCGHGKGMSQL